MSDNYFEGRKNYQYYKYIRFLLGMISYNATSICDVGSNGCDYISFLPCKYKYSIDIKNPLNAQGVVAIKQDFLEYLRDEPFDIITCFQVLEHIADKDIRIFANKLLNLGKICVCSVPYMWEKGYCAEHVQDPVDLEKIVGWFGREPIYIKKVKDKSVRMIVVFADENLTDSICKINGCKYQELVGETDNL